MCKQKLVHLQFQNELFGMKTLKRPVILILLVAGVILPCLVFIVLHFSSGAQSQSQLVLKDAIVISGQSLPKTDLVALNGKSISTDVLRKGKVLLVFITTECAACQKELKLLSQVESDLTNRVNIYGVGIEDPARISTFTQETGIRTKILLDQNADLMRLLSVKYFPTKFLIEDGVITKTSFGNSANQSVLYKEFGF